MSIYSGFGTREQETKYNNYVSQMLLLLEKRILWSCNKENNDQERWNLAFEKLYTNMALMEKYKYLPPKFSQSLNQLASHLGVNTTDFVEKVDWILSRNSSRSFTKSRKKYENLGMKMNNSMTNTIDERINSAEQKHLKEIAKELEHQIIIDSKTLYSTTKKIPTRSLQAITQNKGQKHDPALGKPTNLLNLRLLTPRGRKNFEKQENHLPIVYNISANSKKKWIDFESLSNLSHENQLDSGLSTFFISNQTEKHNNSNSLKTPDLSNKIPLLKKRHTISNEIAFGNSKNDDCLNFEKPNSNKYGKYNLLCEEKAHRPLNEISLNDINNRSQGMENIDKSADKYLNQLNLENHKSQDINDLNIQNNTPTSSIEFI